MTMGSTGSCMYQLNGKIQHYAWGGFEYIPALLGQPATGEPAAEYWMGAHRSAPSVIERPQGNIDLKSLIESAPENILGKATWEKFAELPYLFKILDVKEMLSIQVHPTKSEAEKGFARENEAGIPLDAPYRNYKDANHKPEIMVALSPFYLLHGFLPEAKLKSVLQSVPEFADLSPVFEKEGYYALYKHVMELPQDSVNKKLQALVDRIVPLYKDNKLDKKDPAFWAARAVVNDPQSKDRLDRGIFSIYFFNIMFVQPGQAVFQDAGIPHAYLEGQNVELMANSDNVLRGGLTPKHIDVPELLKHTRFEPVHPEVLNPVVTATKEAIYESPAPDFVVSRIELQPGETYKHTSTAAEILISIQGQASAGKAGELSLSKGHSVFIGFDQSYKIDCTGAETIIIYKASVPLV